MQPMPHARNTKIDMQACHAASFLASDAEILAVFWLIRRYMYVLTGAASLLQFLCADSEITPREGDVAKGLSDYAE
jgi:hypothetical protein